MKNKQTPLRALQKPPVQRGVLFVEGIPQSTREAFKAACAYKGLTQREVVIAFMRKFAEENLLR